MKIKYLRLMKGLKQEHMAPQVNMSQQAYSRVETDRTKPTYEQLKLIMETLGVTMEEFEKWDGRFVFNNYGNPSTSNGQINNHRLQPDEAQNLYQQMLTQKEQENQILKAELDYLKTLIDRLLKTQSANFPS